MGRELSYGLVASLLLWPPVVAAIAACLHTLPTDPVSRFQHIPIFVNSVHREPRNEGGNWVDQGSGTILWNALALVAAVYAAKYLIGQLPVRWMRVYAFALVVAASLPYLWLLVVSDWHNVKVNRVTCWVHGPVGFWVIPAASFVADTIALRVPRPLPYIARSVLEVVLMVPWLVAWAFILIVLGWR